MKCRISALIKQAEQKDIEDLGITILIHICLLALQI